jgi:tetratricopeptide (TPR) repeat protein
MDIIKFVLFIGICVLCFSGYQKFYLPYQVKSLTAQGEQMVSSNPDEAIKRFEQARAIAPENVATLIGIARASLNLKNPGLGNSHLSDIFQLPSLQKSEPDTQKILAKAELFYLYGEICLNLKSYANAVKAYGKSGEFLSEANLSEKDRPDWEKNMIKRTLFAKGFLKK